MNKNMNRLKKVELQADVYLVCLQHALSTENYEVMGLLIGDASFFFFFVTVNSVFN